MKKNYLIALIFSIVFINFSFSQIIANDDTVRFNGVMGGSSDTFLLNDSVNGNPVTPANSLITQLSSTNNRVRISSRAVRVSDGTPSGTYTLVYRLCFDGVCDTATITVIVCNLARPTVSDVVVASCDGLGSIRLNNLPTSGDWTITHTINETSSNETSTTYTGSGSSRVIENLTRGTHRFSVTNDGGCTSTLQEPVDMGRYYYIQASALGTVVDTNLDGMTSVGDQIHYQYSLTNNEACALNNIAIAPYSNSSLVITGGPIVSLASGATDSTTLTATRTITQSDINRGAVRVYVGVTIEGLLSTEFYANTSLSLPDGFKLVAFADLNNNGVQDEFEPNFTRGNYVYQINGGPEHSVTSNNPHTLFESNTSLTYNFRYVVQTPYAAYHSVSPVLYNNMNVTPDGGLATLKFAISELPYKDMEVLLVPNSAARPGFEYKNTITIKNNSNSWSEPGTITFTKDNRLMITNMSEQAYHNSTGFTYNYDRMPSNTSNNIIVTMMVPELPSIALGDLLTNTVSSNIPSGDISPENNTASLTQIVGGSYDPNDKTESHGEKILHSSFTTNDCLIYTIRFENTGTADALKVRITDVLHNDLDDTTLKMLNSSHSNYLRRVGNSLEWIFDDINLPPSISETSSVGKGYVMFQVKPKPGYSVGDIIPNTANIYFDNNPPITTNTFNTEFVTTLDHRDFHLKKISFYPNPVKDKLILKNTENIKSYSVTDLSGKVIFTDTVHSDSIHIDLSTLSKGLYMIQLNSDVEYSTIKIVKE